jgi:hypothetical protein
MSSLPVESAFSDGRLAPSKPSVTAAVATWTFGALAVEECVSYLLDGSSALDAVEKGINKVLSFSFDAHRTRY